MQATRQTTLLRRALFASVFATALFAPPVSAGAAAIEQLGGTVQAEVDGETVLFPTLKTDIEADIRGDLATVAVVQTFANPLPTPVNATYLFPLNKDAAVYEMIMEVGNETVRARIEPVEQARATFKRAQQEGRSAALLTQYRPNMFSQEIANLMPGLPIRVTLRYVQTVAKVDGVYEMVVPLVVGPRFQPVGAGVAPDVEGGAETGASVQAGGVPRWREDGPPATAAADAQAAFGQWELEALPTYPPVTGLDIPRQVDAERVSVAVSLHAGMAIQYVESRTHAIDIQVRSVDHNEITLADQRTVDNRDFVLRYRLAGETNQAGLLSYRDERGGFFSLLIEPPAIPQPSDISAREMVFVLDCSGSMAGLPIEASKAFMREALRKLRPEDSFRIIRFSDAATEFSTRPLAATPGNIRHGIRYTDGLRGSGGTMMSSGIRQALQPPVSAGAMRIVVFLTDGYIGNEIEVLRLVRQTIGSARLFAFGVGTGVNRFLLSELGRVGRGFTRYMDPTEDLREVAVELAERLQSPVLTDIRIDWGELSPSNVMPKVIPDLFAGQSLRVQGRYARSGTYTINVHGRVNGRTAVLPLRVELPEESAQGPAVALTWARSAIGESMRQLSAPIALREANLSDDSLKQAVTKLGLDFSLVTRWTAFVAVSDKIYNNNPLTTPTRPVPLPQVKGVSHLAYGNPTSMPNSPQFTGHATPEPAAILGLTLIVLLFIAFMLRGRLRPWFDE